MITLSEFRARKERLALAARPFRLRCQVCLQPAFSCYCNSIERFDPNIEFVLLIHPVEARRRIATGRMSFLSLENARMFTGAEFQNHKEIGEILKEPENCCMVLWPGPQSVNLSGLGSQKLHEMFHPQKHLVIFVIDGTWATAKKMLRQSPELGGLPQICFTPPSPSNFRVRQQPAKGLLFNH